MVIFGLLWLTRISMELKSNSNQYIEWHHCICHSSKSPFFKTKDKSAFFVYGMAFGSDDTFNISIPHFYKEKESEWERETRVA